MLGNEKYENIGYCTLYDDGVSKYSTNTDKRQIRTHKDSCRQLNSNRIHTGFCRIQNVPELASWIAGEDLTECDDNIEDNDQDHENICCPPSEISRFRCKDNSVLQEDRYLEKDVARTKDGLSKSNVLRIISITYSIQTSHTHIEDVDEPLDAKIPHMGMASMSGYEASRNNVSDKQHPGYNSTNFIRDIVSIQWSIGINSRSAQLGFFMMTSFV